jgi:type IV pilus assembly protein PilW
MRILSMDSQLNRSSGRHAEIGYSLIELLISLTLGLLLVAAATQLFLGGTIGVRLQQAGADVQDNGLFGVDLMTRHLRMTNLTNGTTGPVIDTTSGGGVVLTAASVSSTTPISLCLVTNGNGDTVSGCTTNQWTGLSNVQGSIKSDQLTIQFQAPAAMTDCEGGQVTAGTQVIERFFLRLDTLPGSPVSDPALQNIVLACNAGTITGGALTGSAGTGTFGGAGQVLMNRVDQFHVLLGTAVQAGSTTAGNLAYQTINQYKNMAFAPATIKPNILSIQIALLIRSMDNTGNAALDSAPSSYTLFDQTVTPSATAVGKNRYVRQAYLTTVAFRNAAGVSTS